MKSAVSYLFVLLLVLVFPNPASAENQRQLIRQTQQILTYLGYDPGPVDGAVGPRTRRAIRDFQKSRSLKINGETSWELLKQLSDAAEAGEKSVKSLKVQGSHLILAQSIRTRAKRAILIDFGTGAVLYEKKADQLFPPASMSKLMTLALIFEALKTGEIRLDDTFKTSQKAWRRGGAVMFLRNGALTKISELLKGSIVQSANDAAITLAEGYAGSEEVFANLMEKKARRIGLERSTFGNATGLPHPRQRMTVREIAKLTEYLIREYPQFYLLFSMKTYSYGKHRFHNRNPLLYNNIGVDGLKTGHTRASGYGLVGSGSRDGRRLIFVVSGLNSKKERKEEALRLYKTGMDHLRASAKTKNGSK